MPKELQKGAPPLIRKELEKNTELVQEHRRLILDIFNKLGLINEDDRKLYISEDDFDIGFVISPVSACVRGQDESEVKFEVSPFQIYVFIFYREWANGKTMMDAKTIVLSQDHNVSACYTHINGKSLEEFTLTINLEQERILNLSMDYIISDACDTWVGDYLETYTVTNYLNKRLKTKVEVLREIKDQLST